LHNIAVALMQSDETLRRLPASGNYAVVGPGQTLHNHSWAVSILPWIDQQNLYNNWNLDKAITDPVNYPLTQTYLPVYVCPLDISRSKKKDKGDLSYVVNGGVGYTTRIGNVDDSVVAPNGPALDLNGNGVACPANPAADGQPSDRTLFKRLGLFFVENWKTGPTQRHLALGDVKDGLSQTFLVSENVRAGYDPADPESGFANPNPFRCAFYIGNPCPTGSCTTGNVNYSQCNTGTARINSGLWASEGGSPVPNSFHEASVHMAFADGHVQRLSEAIDGKVYAALASPTGLLLNDTPLRQTVVNEDSY
jgi:prepilin-type processing-associated H-X9-DG protein